VTVGGWRGARRRGDSLPLLAPAPELEARGFQESLSSIIVPDVVPVASIPICLAGCTAARAALELLGDEAPLVVPPHLGPHTPASRVGSQNSCLESVGHDMRYPFALGAALSLLAVVRCERVSSNPRPPRSGSWENRAATHAAIHHAAAKPAATHVDSDGADEATASAPVLSPAFRFRGEGLVECLLRETTTIRSYLTPIMKWVCVAMTSIMWVFVLTPVMKCLC
jgi:hypothetical protein